MTTCSPNKHGRKGLLLCVCEDNFLLAGLRHYDAMWSIFGPALTLGHGLRGMKPPIVSPPRSPPLLLYLWCALLKPLQSIVRPLVIKFTLSSSQTPLHRCHDVGDYTRPYNQGGIVRQTPCLPNNLKDYDITTDEEVLVKSDRALKKSQLKEYCKLQSLAIRKPSPQLRQRGGITPGGARLQ